MNNPTNEMDDQPVRYSDVVEIDESKIPEKIRHLTNYAKAWSISDDAIRADVMARSSYEEKKEFVDAVDPFLSDIEDWCNYYSDRLDWPDEVPLFEIMFEALAEARKDVLFSRLDERPND